MAKVGRPTYLPDEAERVRAAAAKLLHERFDGVNAALGRELGITGQAVGKIVGGSGGPSTLTVERIAAMTGVTVDELLGRPPASARAPGGERVVVPVDRYPNRVRAITAARALGYSDEAIERVQSLALSRDDDPSPREWLRRIEVEEDDVRRPRAPDARQQEADAARLVEMEQATKPKLPKRRT